MTQHDILIYVLVRRRCAVRVALAFARERGFVVRVHTQLLAGYQSGGMSAAVASIAL